MFAALRLQVVDVGGWAADLVRGRSSGKSGIGRFAPAMIPAALFQREDVQ